MADNILSCIQCGSVFNLSVVNKLKADARGSFATNIQHIQHSQCPICGTEKELMTGFLNMHTLSAELRRSIEVIQDARIRNQEREMREREKALKTSLSAIMEQKSNKLFQDLLDFIGAHSDEFKSPV
jgi:hypothetical protein